MILNVFFFKKKTIFRIGMWHSKPPRDPTPPPFMANAILNFHFDFLTPSLSQHTKRSPTYRMNIALTQKHTKRPNFERGAYSTLCRMRVKHTDVPCLCLFTNVRSDLDTGSRATSGSNHGTTTMMTMTMTMTMTLTTPKTTTTTTMMI